MENQWKKLLVTKGWSQTAIRFHGLCIANSTKQQYDSVINQFIKYCGLEFGESPPANVATVANFLSHLGMQSDRPRSKVNIALAALQQYYNACDMFDVCNDVLIKKLVIGIVKGGTLIPRVKTPAMPIKPFHDLFLQWPSNEDLTLPQIRLKCVTLFALVAMLRPSDIAPRGVVLDQDMVVKSITFNTQDLDFLQDGSLNVTIHGNKNDYAREGFNINVPPASVNKLDPVTAIKCYLQRTEKFRSQSVPNVFLSLQRKQGFHQGLQSSGIRGILNESIKLAGLDPAKFSSKCFRVTGAMTAVRVGQDPNTVLLMGRWKSCSVFEEHYVHNVPPTNYTDSILGN